MLRAASNNAIASDIMRLSCPECQAEYEVPDAALTGRPRTLRCASCGTTWKTPAAAVALASESFVIPDTMPPGATVAPEAGLDSAGDDTMEAEKTDQSLPEIAAPPVIEPQLSAARLKTVRAAQAAQAPKPAVNSGLRISILVLVLLIALVLAEHRAIMTAWPPSARLFDAIGLR